MPGGVDPGLYDSMTSVNTFPTLFSGYFGLDMPRLEDREFTSAGKNRPYDLTEITERLRRSGRLTVAPTTDGVARIHGASAHLQDGVVTSPVATTSPRTAKRPKELPS